MPTKIETMLAALPYADHLAIHNALNRQIGGLHTVSRFDTRANGVRRTALFLQRTNFSLEQAAKLADVVLPTSKAARAIAAENPDDSDPVHEDKTDTEDHETGLGDKTEDDAKTDIETDAKTAEDAVGGATASADQMRVLHATDAEMKLLHQAVFAFKFHGEVDADTITALLTRIRTAPLLEAKPARAAARRTTSKPRQAGGRPASHDAIITVCTRTDGATAKEMAEACGWPTIAARTVCTKIAERYGYTLREEPRTKERGITFYLRAASGA